MKTDGVTSRNLGLAIRLTMGLVVATTGILAAVRPAASQEIIAGEIVIEPGGLRPSVLMTEPERRVTFVNRSGKVVHVDFIFRDPELHHTVQVSDKIWAVFHRPGRHPYEVHFQDRALADLHGVIEIVGDPYGGPDARICSGITVQGACIER